MALSQCYGSFSMLWLRLDARASSRCYVTAAIVLSRYSFISMLWLPCYDLVSLLWFRLNDMALPRCCGFVLMQWLRVDGMCCCCYGFVSVPWLRVDAMLHLYNTASSR